MNYKIIMFGRSACSGCQLLKPKLQTLASSLGVNFVYANLDTQEGEDIFNSYQGLPFMLPVVLFTDLQGVPLDTMPYDAFQYSVQDIVDYINTNINPLISTDNAGTTGGPKPDIYSETSPLYEDSDFGSDDFSTPDDAPKGKSIALLVLGFITFKALT